MIHVIYIDNPINLSSRKQKDFVYNPEFTIENYLKMFALIDLECYSISLNGKVLELGEVNLPIPDDSYIVFMPTIEKDAFKFILSIAVPMLAIGVGNLLATGSWGTMGTMMGHWGFSSYLAAAAVMTVGGNYLSSMLNPSVDSSDSTTYGWNTQSTGYTQGTPIQRTYGKVKVCGQVLAKHIITSGDYQYLNVLLSGGEGYIDSFSNLAIDDNPLENYNNVAVAYRNGSNTQSVISGFGDTYTDIGLSYELTTTTSSTHQLDGNTYQGIEVVIECPYGLYYANDSGGLSNTSVSVEILYRLVGATDWITIATPTIKAAQSSALRRTYAVSNLTAGQYEVKCRCTGKSGTGSRYINRVYWTMLSGIVYDDFSYPNVALVGISALATENLSGSTPTFSWIQERSVVYVYNPNTSEYDTVAANNPAWACYDLIHRCDKIEIPNASGTGSGQYEYYVDGESADTLIYSEFKAWADWCTLKGLKVNIYIDTADSLWNQLAKIEEMGRGKVIIRGTKYGVMYDCEADPVQLFNVENITVSKFTEEFMSIEDKANALEITFYNEEANYEETTITVFSSNYDADEDIINPSQKTYYGCTSLESAIREGTYALELTNNTIRTVSISVDIDAIACQPGNVIAIQHPVPKWGTTGARVVSFDSVNNKITLDKKVTMKANISYAIFLRNIVGDTIEKVQNISLSPVTTDTTTDIISLATAPEGSISKDDLISFGETANVSKKFRVIDTTRNGDLKRDIKAVEYNADIYNEHYSTYTIDTTVSTPGVAVTNLSAVQQNIVQNNTVVNGMIVNWTIPRGYSPDYCSVFLSLDGSNWTNYERVYDGHSLTIQGITSGTYSVKVNAVYGLSVFTRQVNDVLVDGSDPINSDISASCTNITYNESFSEAGNGSILVSLSFNWTIPATTSFKSMQVWIISNNPPSNEVTVAADSITESGESYWSHGVWKQLPDAYDNTVVSGLEEGKTYRIKFVCETKSGTTESFDDAPYIEYTVQGKTLTPYTPTGLAYRFTSTTMNCYWDATTQTDVDFFELRTDTNYGATEGLLIKTLENDVDVVPANRSGTLYLYAHNKNSKYSEPAIEAYTKALPSAPTITVVSVFQGLIASVPYIAATCSGMNVHVNNGVTEEVFYETGNTHKYSAVSGGIFNVRIAYVDIFGEGILSEYTQVVVKVQIDDSLVDAEGLSLASMNTTIKDALVKAQDAIDETTFNNSIATINDSITALDGAKVSHTEFTNEVNTLVQVDADNKSLITQTANSVTSVIGMLNSSASDPNQYSSISTLKQQADSIIATLASSPDATGQYNSIAQLKIASDSIIATLGKAPDATGQYSAISQLKILADGISSTVQSNKTTQDGVNSGFSSQISQNSTSISSVVTELNKPIDTCSYTSIVQALSAINLRATKANLISQINICPEAITIDGKYLHVTGNTVFDAGVIVQGLLAANAVTSSNISTGAITVGALADDTKTYISENGVPSDWKYNSTYINGAKIYTGTVIASALNVSSLSSITATIGTLRTATTGARTEIKDNLIEVYDANNVLRVRMGVW